MDEAPHNTLLQFHQWKNKTNNLHKCWQWLLCICARPCAFIKPKTVVFIHYRVVFVWSMVSINLRFGNFIEFIYLFIELSYLTGTITLYSFRRFIPMSSIHRNHTLCSSVLLLALLSALQLHSTNSLQHKETVVLQLMAKQLDHREYIEQTRHWAYTYPYESAQKKVPSNDDMGAKEKGISGRVLDSNNLLACLVVDFVG